MWTCHQNFGPGKNGPRTKILVPPVLCPKKLAHIENFGPGVAVNHRAFCGQVVGL